MKLIEFPEQTVVIAKDQPEYLPMPAHQFEDDPQGCVTCCWKLTLKERIMVLLGGRVWHQILTFNDSIQPQKLQAAKPFLGFTIPGQTQQWLEELNESK